MTREELLTAYTEGRRDFRGATLTGSNLTNADLTNADLTKADLTGVHFNATHGIEYATCIWTVKTTCYSFFWYFLGSFFHLVPF